MNKVLILIAVVFLCSTANAQNTYWRKLQGHPQKTNRIDDIYFLNRAIGFSVTNDGDIYKTSDTGLSWSRKHSSGGLFRSIEFSADGKYGIAGTLIGGKVFRTTDSGETWQDISANVPDTGIGTNKNKICGLAHFNNKFYGVGWWGANVARFYRSNDTGNTWTVDFLDSNLVSGLVDVMFLSENVCFITGSRHVNGKARENMILRSVDTGHTWTKVASDSIIGGRVWKIQFLDSLHGFASIEPYYTRDTACYWQTHDGGLTWVIHSAGVVPQSKKIVQGIGFLNRKTGWIGGWFDGYFETNDSGNTWKYVLQGADFNRFFKVDSTFMYASARGVYIYDSTSYLSIEKSEKNQSETHCIKNIYPNPTQGKVNVQVQIASSTNVLIELANIETRQTHVMLRKVLAKGLHNFVFDCSSMPPGNYFVSMGTDAGYFTQKFTLLK